MPGKQLFPVIGVPGRQADIQGPPRGPAGALHPDDVLFGCALVASQASKFRLAFAEIIFCGKGQFPEILKAFYVSGGEVARFHFSPIEGAVFINVRYFPMKQFSFQPVEPVSCHGLNVFVPVVVLGHGFPP